MGKGLCRMYEMRSSQRLSALFSLIVGEQEKAERSGPFDFEVTHSNGLVLSWGLVPRGASQEVKSRVKASPNTNRMAGCCLFLKQL